MSLWSIKLQLDGNITVFSPSLRRLKGSVEEVIFRNGMTEIRQGMRSMHVHARPYERQN